MRHLSSIPTTFINIKQFSYDKKGFYTAINRLEFSSFCKIIILRRVLRRSGRFVELFLFLMLLCSFAAVK